LLGRLTLAAAPYGPAARAGPREVDEPVEELGVANARDLPQTRVHRDRGEPGNRVELVDDETAVVAQEEVDARHRLDAARLERAHGQRAYLGGLFVRERRGREQLGLAVLVLVRVVVEVGGRDHLARERRDGRVVTEDRDL